MNPIDKNYLSLQFWLRVYRKKATEFQSFFEDIMGKAFSDFRKIRPYGNEGDGGNDGYRPSAGEYFQVYAPLKPEEKEAKAAEKLKDNFKDLKDSWDEISKIKKYNFVFNDKEGGITIKLEQALAELRSGNPEIKFEIFTAKDLESIFFGLKQEDMLSLGFDIDSTKAISNAWEYLDKVEIDLDRDNPLQAEKALDKIKDIITSLKDEALTLEYELLEARTLQKLEKADEALEKYLNLSKRFLKDPRPLLYIAEFYLNEENFEENEKFLNEAEKIDKTHWLLKLERLIREYRLGSELDIESIDENSFPHEPKIKSGFYRLYSLFIERAGDFTKAENFIEKAIHANPNKLSNYDAKLALLEEKYLSNLKNKEQAIINADEYFKEIEKIEKITADWGEHTGRNQATLNFRKLRVFRIKENKTEIERVCQESFEQILQSYFDQWTEKLLINLLSVIELPKKDLERLFKYLERHKKPISKELGKALVFQFILKENLLAEGKKFFESIKNQPILDFIISIENKDYDKTLLLLKEDPIFAVMVANTAKSFPDLRKKIIEELPNDGTIEKDKLLLLLNYDEGNIDGAFKIIKNFDLSKLGYFECKHILDIAEKKNAWDFVIQICEKLLEYEDDKHTILQVKLRLFTANFNLERYPEVARIGEEILNNKEEMAMLVVPNNEILFGQTIMARMRRGEFPAAKDLVEKHKHLFKNFELKQLEAEVYIKNNDPDAAVASVVDGIKILKHPSQEQYGSLFLIFTEVAALNNFGLDSLKEVVANSFVKLKGQERWYFVGDEEELDATKISSTDEKYKAFIGKKTGEKIVFENKYRSEQTELEVETIYPIEKYTHWQCMDNARKLSIENRWDKMEVIDVPTTGETIDPKYLIARLEDEKKKHGEFFELYCKENIPLAFLAINQGGLMNALGTIINENKGFVKFSSGDLSEINEQKKVAKRIIGGESFYIDGTSALILAETGLLEELYNLVPNIKVPQSVISLLLEASEKFRYSPGQVGHMGYSQGKLKFSEIDKEKRDKLQSNFEKSIKLLESKKENIGFISSANKFDSFSEQKIPASLCDACILAQKENIPVLTEDFLYLKLNELDTKKKSPEYFSAFALISTLYEQGKISYEKYLSFFSYLSSYRFRFLPINTKDIEKAVFGSGDIATIKPENIQLLNFPLTLSEEYGVPFNKAFLVVAPFILKILIDDTILPETAKKIFTEVLTNFPHKNKKFLGSMLIRTCVLLINKQFDKLVIGANTQEKIDRLSNLTDIFTDSEIVLP